MANIYKKFGNILYTSKLDTKIYWKPKKNFIITNFLLKRQVISSIYFILKINSIYGKNKEKQLLYKNVSVTLIKF